MQTSLTIHDFHQRYQKRLQLSFASAMVGLERKLSHSTGINQGHEIVDYLNIIRPVPVVIIGLRESAWLGAQTTRQQLDIFHKLLHQSLCTIILGQGARLLDTIIKFCEEENIAVFRSELNDAALLNDTRYFINQALTESTTEHGVFIEIHSIGTFIMGESGVGKSELALSLISRGHRLIADDITEFSSIAPGVIDGMHPGLSNEFMEVRGVGIINVRAMFGSNALRRNKTLRMIVNLVHFTPENRHQFDRLGNDHKTRRILGHEIPMMTLPVAPGRNLAILVEAAARNHLMSINGYNAADDFIERQRLAILANSKEQEL